MEASINESNENVATTTLPFHVPAQVLDDLDNTSETALKQNIVVYTNDLPQYEGDSWICTDQLNKELYGQVRKHKLDSVSVINRKYWDKDRLQVAGRAATEAFEILAQAIKRGRESENIKEDLHLLLEKL
ncbi:hypothetical protein BJV82DRAFT_676306 [Fennellomyces sp. T-0311]|nr:hypothetical protein BJV82DRAFT_676306 [Fennellomyces sp. T-0311]